MLTNETRGQHRNKKIALTMGITNNWAFAGGTILFGLRDNPPTVPHDLIIYENDLDEKNKKLLNQIYPCIFKKFDISRIYADDFPRLSKMTFSRYENFSLLKEYSTVAWLDADILIKGDISELLQHFPTGIAMHKHKDTPLKSGMKGEIKRYNLNKEAFAAGSLVLSDNLKNPEILKEWCYKRTNDWANKINGDMQILNLMLQEFNITPYELDETYCCHPRKETSSTLIIHPWWRKKFWNKVINPQWDHYYKKWKVLGGEAPKLPYPIKRWVKYKLWRMRLLKKYGKNHL